MQEAKEGSLGPFGKEGIVCGRELGLKAKEGSSMQDKKIRYTGRKGSLMRFVVNDGFEVSSTRTNRRSALESISTVQGLFVRRRRTKGSDRVPFPIEFQI
jgi:TnpA family transposase